MPTLRTVGLSGSAQHPTCPKKRLELGKSDLPELEGADQDLQQVRAIALLMANEQLLIRRSLVRIQSGVLSLDCDSCVPNDVDKLRSAAGHAAAPEPHGVVAPVQGRIRFGELRSGQKRRDRSVCDG
jgi:hypothetical protein